MLYICTKICEKLSQRVSGLLSRHALHTEIYKEYNSILNVCGVRARVLNTLSDDVLYMNLVLVKLSQRFPRNGPKQYGRGNGGR